MTLHTESSSYLRFQVKISCSVPRYCSGKMASILPASPIHNVNINDFPWNCRYPRSNLIFEKNWFQYEDSINKNVIVICGPSGSGKSTLLKLLMNEHPDCFGFSISHTTRNPREGEVPGKDYHFVSRDDMLKAIGNGEFLEHTEFSGNIYGTSKRAVNSVIQRGRICILDIEIEGVKNIKNTDFDAKYIFIKPPSIQILEDRLRGRGTETEESIQKRLARAKTELAYGEIPGNFDFVLVNDSAAETYQELKKFLKKDIEDLRKKRYQK